MTYGLSAGETRPYSRVLLLLCTYTYEVLPWTGFANRQVYFLSRTRRRDREDFLEMVALACLSCHNRGTLAHTRAYSEAFCDG